MKSTPKVSVCFLFCMLLFSRASFAQDIEELKNMSLEDLMNLQVTTVSKSAEKLSDAPGVISVLSRDELERFGGTTLKDILERVPGLISSSAYMTDRSMIAPRGDQVQVYSVHTLLLINGRPIRESLEGGIKTEILETFPVNAVERIEVIKGPGSVLYGSNAFSAVINVITEKAEGTNISIIGITGEDGSYGTQGELKLKTGDLNIVAAGRLFQKADWETNYSVRVPDSPNYVVPINIPDKGFGVFFNAGFKGLSVMASHNKFTNFFIIPDYMPYLEAYGDAVWEKLFTNIGYDLQITNKWRTNLNVTYTNSKFEIEKFPSIKRDSDDIVAEFTNFVTISDKSRLVIGGLFNRVQGGETFYGEPPAVIPVSDANRNAYGFYGQIDYKLLGNVKAIAGVQLNKIEELDMNLVPRAGVIWYPISAINVKALYSEAFRAPSINEFSMDHPVLKGNRALNPEIIGTFDFCVTFQGDHAQATASVFRSKMTNVIYPDWTDPTKIGLYKNGGEIKSTGFELEGKYYLNKSVYLVGSLLNHYTKNQDGNEDITPIAKLGAKTGFSYVSEKGVTLSLFDIYQGDLSDYFKNTPNIDPGVYNIVYLHTKFELNKLFNWSMKPEFVLTLQIDNLLDKEVWFPAWGLDPGQSLPVNPGRVIYGGVIIEF